MKLKIARDIASDEKVFGSLIHVLIAHKNRHCIDVESGLDILPIATGITSELLKGLITANSYGGNFDFVIEVSNKQESKYQVLPSQLHDYLCRPAVVVVENGTSDRGFILCALKVMGEHSLIDKLNTSWEIRSAGGCGEIPKIIEDECIKFSFAPRLVVIHDSDLEYPNQILNITHQNIREKAREKGICSWLLKKREMENYIPDLAIDRVFHDKKSLLEAFHKLNPHQKDYFDYKSGFSKMKHAAINCLYADVELNEVLELYNGFGKKISDKAFADDVVYSMDDFTVRCDKIMEEFTEIICAIRSVL